MKVTKKQTEELISKFLSKKNGLNEVLFTPCIKKLAFYDKCHTFNIHPPLPLYQLIIKK